MSESRAHLENKLKRLECHFTWGLNPKFFNLNFLEIRLRETISIAHIGGTSEYNRKGRALNYLAYVKHLQGCNQGALKHLKEAEEENKHNASKCIVTYGNMAWVYHHMGEHSNAQTCLRKLEEIIQSLPAASPTALFQHREVYEEKGYYLLSNCSQNIEGLLGHYSSALRREPDDKEWNTGYALSLTMQELFSSKKFRSGQNAEENLVAKQLQKALTLDPDNAMLWVYLGIISNRDGNKSEAKMHIDKAIQMAPQNVKVILKAAAFLRSNEHIDEAIEALNEVLKAAPGSARLHYKIFECYRDKAKTGSPELFPLCISHLEKTISLNRKYIYPQLDLALMHAEMGEIEKGERMLHEIQNKPDLSLNEKQIALRYQGDLQLGYKNSEQEAVKYYKEAKILKAHSNEWYRCCEELEKIERRNQAGN